MINKFIHADVVQNTQTRRIIENEGDKDRRRKVSEEILFSKKGRIRSVDGNSGSLLIMIIIILVIIILTIIIIRAIIIVDKKDEPTANIVSQNYSKSMFENSRRRDHVEVVKPLRSSDLEDLVPVQVATINANLVFVYIQAAKEDFPDLMRES